MGSSRWSSDSYTSMSSSFVGKATDDVFGHTKTRTMSADMNPIGVTFRECRDSDTHPETLAVFVALDETGSMGDIPDKLVRGKLGNLMESLLKVGVNDAQVLFAGVGDSTSDHFPLQVGQFESGDTELVKWLTSVNLEGNGGGHGKESYPLAWLFAARHTSIDCYEKRGIKGVLFTIGDEMPWEVIRASEQMEFLGYSQAEDLSAEELLAEVTRMYHVYHIHVVHGGRSSYHDDYADKTVKAWQKLIGQNVIVCEDYTTVAELISTTVAMIHGIDMDEFTKQFDDKTATSVKNALVKTGGVITRKKTEEGIITL